MADLIDRDALEPFYESGTDPKDPYADLTFIRAEHIKNAPAVENDYEHGFIDGLKAECLEELKPVMAKLIEGCTEAIKCIAPMMIENAQLHITHAVNRWIPCSVRLPEFDKDVLVYAVRKDGLGDAVTTITRYINYIWFGHRVDTEPYWEDAWQYFHSDYEITHWMPLPEPTERKENSDE